MFSFGKTRPVASRIDQTEVNTLTAAWDDVVTALIESGWARVPSALAGGLADRLAACQEREWQLLGDEGRVKQHAYGSGVSYVDAAPLVRSVGDSL
jgi:hypothetical protein